MLTATDLFAGAGGSSEGMRQAGIDVRVCANHWPRAVETHQLNHPDTEHRLADLSETDFRTFPRTDILWASPSCVWHTPAGGRKRIPVADELARTDPGAIDRATAFAVIQAAEVHRYPVVLVENVPEFRSWTLYDWWLSGMAALGYTAQVQVLDAADFGVPQSRKRLFIAFSLAGPLRLDHEPRRVPATVALDAGGNYRRTTGGYVAPQLAQIDEDLVAHIVTYRKHARARNAHRHPFATITASRNHQHIAYRDRGEYWKRDLTTTEVSRAMGFPDTYQVGGTKAERQRQLGNAVPPPVARFLAERAKEVLV